MRRLVVRVIAIKAEIVTVTRTIAKAMQAHSICSLSSSRLPFPKETV